MKRGYVFFVRFKVLLNGNVISLFGSNNYKHCEDFCNNYDGNEEEIYIEKVWVKSETSIGENE